MTLHKACGIWFSGKRLGLANGFVSAGMATGFMTGSLFSATVLSPWLGGWRQVMFFYGAIAGIMAVPWLFTRSVGGGKEEVQDSASFHSVKASLSAVMRIGDVWLLGFALLGVGGCVQGLLGYLPLYLREIGWMPSRADAALGAFHAISLAAVFPITMISDRLGSRKKLLVPAAAMVMLGTALVGAANGNTIWVAVLVAGIVRDGFMALFMTMVTELKGVGARYAGTAIGLSLTFGRLGELLAPPVGNALAAWNMRLPFLFWALMAFGGFIVLIQVQRTRKEAAHKSETRSG
jgi:cyanate permease